MKECPACRRCFPDNVNHCPDDGDATTQSIIGEPVLDGRYQLERRIGHGGMGVVFQARHIFLKTAHAIKVILPDLVGNDPMLVTRFRQEALAAAAIRHQNIIAVTDFGVVRGTMPFLVMEFVSGKSLHDMLVEEGALPPARALEIISAVGSGVAAAHRQGIVHRDLKPLNIMFQEGLPTAEAVKVLDFGLAKIKSGELLGSFVQAKTSGLMGSPFYMAPEQWGDEEPDARADIYSLGVILFQMLGGVVPFKGTSIPSIMKKHLTAAPPSFESLGVNVPPQIEAVVRHALEKEAENRPASVQDFINELRDAVDSVSAFLNRTSLTNISPHAQTIIEAHGTTSLPPDTTTLRVRTSQPRARVFVNNVSVGTTDDVGQLTVPDMLRGTHQIQVLHEGFAEWSQKIECSGGVCDVEARLQDLTATNRPQQDLAATNRAKSVMGYHSLSDPQAGTMRPGSPQISLAAIEEQERREQEERERLAGEAARLKAEEEAKRKAEEERLRAEKEHRAAEEAKRRAEEEEAARLRAEEEERRKAEEERLRLEEEARLAAEAEAARVREEEAARVRAEEERRQREEEEARRREEEEARRKAEEERLRAEEKARRLAEAEARRVAEEEARRKAEEERLRAEKKAKPVAPTALLVAIIGLVLVGGGIGVWYMLPAGENGPGNQNGENGNGGPPSAALSIKTEELPQAMKGLPYSGKFEAEGGAGPYVWSPESGALPDGLTLGSDGTISGRTEFVGTATFTVQVKDSLGASSAKQFSLVVAHSGPELISIPGGRFMMGRDSEDGGTVPQVPAHAVPVRPFAIDKTEVTNAEYAEFVSATRHKPPSHWGGARPVAGTELLPVVNVSYRDAVEFAKWRSKRDGKFYRLPNEEEWEYAARGGDQGNLYPWGNTWAEGYAGVMDPRVIVPKPVGSYPKDRTRWGVLDMQGNVYEWTLSRATYYPGNPQQVRPENRDWIVIRGASFSTDSELKLPLTFRNWYDPGLKNNLVGFRLVRPGP